MGRHAPTRLVPAVRLTVNPIDLSRGAPSAQIHGHEVIAMIRESGQAYSRDSLTAAIEARFGAEARFYTCSAEGLSAGELIDFLENRGKFIPRAGGFTVDPAKVCQH